MRPDSRSRLDAEVENDRAATSRLVAGFRTKTSWRHSHLPQRMGAWLGFGGLESRHRTARLPPEQRGGQSLPQVRDTGESDGGSRWTRKISFCREPRRLGRVVVHSVRSVTSLLVLHYS